MHRAASCTEPVLGSSDTVSIGAHEGAAVASVLSELGALRCGRTASAGVRMVLNK